MVATPSTSSASASPARPAARPKRRKGARGSQGRSCRVPGCTAALEPGYCEAYRICRTHHRADSFQMDGNTCRYCQQCGKIHCLSEFDKGRQSCRMSLSRHQRARLLRQLRNAPAAGQARGQAGKAGKAGKKRVREEQRQPTQQKDAGKPAAAAPAPAATAASSAGPAPPPAATSAASCLATQLPALALPAGVPVPVPQPVPQLMLLEERLQPTTPRISLQSVLPGTMHAALLAKDAGRPPPQPAALAVPLAAAGAAAGLSAPLPAPDSVIEQPLPQQHCLPVSVVTAGGSNAEDLVPLVPELLHPVPCQPGPPFPPQPRPDLVHRALEMLDSPHEPGSGEMPSVDELLDFNAQLGLRLHSGGSSSSDLPLLLDIGAQPAASKHAAALHASSKRRRLAEVPPPALTQSLVSGGAASDQLVSQASYPRLHLSRPRSTATQAVHAAAVEFPTDAAMSDFPRKPAAKYVLGAASLPLPSIQHPLQLPLAACRSLDAGLSLPLHAVPVTPEGNCGSLPAMLLGPSFIA
ncbi:hypothetical protein D9Q98_009424 [Chlorella vulgaris]|uniref:SBP-type domain-containing protein n=1 Tax=Chlorella vulgaris TaxID=3077 RepID=A0A9D4YST4_CHLVU|nr:hypothetical protein D9Q98_009424 [Chlorella vulgaris]